MSTTQTPAVPSRWQVFQMALVATLPILASYLLLGFGFGVLLQRQGLDWVWAPVMSVLLYAGAMQFVTLDAIAQGLSLVSIVVLTIAVNGRHIFYAIAKLTAYSQLGAGKYLAAFQLTDEVFAIQTTQAGSFSWPEQPPAYHAAIAKAHHAFTLWLGMLTHLYWIVGCTLGALMGPILPVDTTGIDFAMTALFVVALIDQLERPETRPQAITGLVLSALGLAVFGGEHFLIPTILGIVLASLIFRRHGPRPWDTLRDEHERPDTHPDTTQTTKAGSAAEGAGAVDPLSEGAVDPLSEGAADPLSNGTGDGAGDSRADTLPHSGGTRA